MIHRDNMVVLGIELGRLIMSLHDDMLLMGDRAVAAARALARLSSRRKNTILEAMADELDARREAIKAANAQGHGGRPAGRPVRRPARPARC